MNGIVILFHIKLIWISLVKGTYRKNVNIVRQSYYSQ